MCIYFSISIYNEKIADFFSVAQAQEYLHQFKIWRWNSDYTTYGLVHAKVSLLYLMCVIGCQII